MYNHADNFGTIPSLWFCGLTMLVVLYMYSSLNISVCFPVNNLTQIKLVMNTAVQHGHNIYSYIWAVYSTWSVHFKSLDSSTCKTTICFQSCMTIHVEFHQIRIKLIGTITWRMSGFPLNRTVFSNFQGSRHMGGEAPHRLCNYQWYPHPPGDEWGDVGDCHVCYVVTPPPFWGLCGSYFAPPFPLLFPLPFPGTLGTHAGTKGNNTTI